MDFSCQMAILCSWARPPSENSWLAWLLRSGKTIPPRRPRTVRPVPPRLQATQELLRHGHRRVGFITNIEDVPATRGRLRGYRDALRDAGIDYRNDAVASDVSETPGGYRTALQLLARPNRPTAVFAYNDRMAMGLYRAARELDLEIPRDLSVISIDNQEIIADGLHPGLTSMALPHYEMGAWAVQHLIALLRTPEGELVPQPEHKILSCPIVRRGSIAAPPRNSLEPPTPQRETTPRRRRAPHS
jgi:LacI family transcriptional regulator